ncbi:MAG: response regulator transcription factor [Armatimonadetes bacterium]|nr:response regulator transcription factor [Armatimonadota bacterium]
MMPAMLERKTITIGVVEPVTIARQELTGLFIDTPDFEVVGSAASVPAALDALKDTAPDLLLIDIGNGDVSMIDEANMLRSVYPEAKTILLSGCNDESTALRAISSRVEGYLASGITSERLISAVRSVYSGEYVFDLSYTASALRKLVDMALPSVRLADDERLSVLSEREREIVYLLCQGLTNQEIARTAFVSINTVKTHLRRIFGRLGVSSRRELVRIAQPARLAGIR